MIVLQRSDAFPFVSHGISVRQNVKSVAFPTDATVSEFCNCTCEEVEDAFYFGDGSDEYKNDKTAVLFEASDDFGSYGIILIAPNGAEIPLGNNSFGTLFNKGFNALNNDLFGYLIDWNKVHSATGQNGYFRYRIDVDNFGVPFSFTSKKYHVQPFDEEIADKSIKIESYNSGVIINGVDYSGMTWYRSIRFNGLVGNYDTELEVIEAVNSRNEPIQVQSKLIEKFTVEIFPSSSEALLPLIKGDSLSNRILLSSYNLYEFQPLNRVPIKINSINFGSDYDKTTLRSVNLDVSKIETITKRNV